MQFCSAPMPGTIVEQVDSRKSVGFGGRLGKCTWQSKLEAITYDFLTCFDLVVCWDGCPLE